MLVKLNDGRMKDVAITEVTPDNYIVPAGEECFWHCIIEVRKFSPETGKRLSVPRVQKFDDKMWKTVVERNLRLQGYTVTILHDPTEDIKNQAEKKDKLRVPVTPAVKSTEEQEREFQEAVKKAVAAEIAKLSKISKGKKDADNGSTKGK